MLFTTDLAGNIVTERFYELGKYVTSSVPTHTCTHTNSIHTDDQVKADGQISSTASGFKAKENMYTMVGRGQFCIRAIVLCMIANFSITIGQCVNCKTLYLNRHVSRGTAFSVAPPRIR